MNSQHEYHMSHETLTEEALNYFKKPLPLPLQELHKQLNLIPKQMYSLQLEGSIQSKNKALVFSHYKQLAQLTANTYLFEIYQNHEKPDRIIEKLSKNLYSDYPVNGQFYAQSFYNYMKQYRKQPHFNENPHQMLILLLRTLALIHCQNFQIHHSSNRITMTKQGVDGISIPEKYSAVIQSIQEDIFGYQDGQFKKKSLKNLNEQTEADNNAENLRTLFFGSPTDALPHNKLDVAYPELSDYRKSIRKTTAQQNQKKQQVTDSFKLTNSVLVQQQPQQRKVQNSEEIDIQNPLNQLIRAVEDNRLKRGQEEMIKIKEEVPDSLSEFKSKANNPTYYQIHTIHHFAQLIINQANRKEKPSFDISYIKNQPYLRRFAQQLKMQIHLEEDDDNDKIMDATHNKLTSKNQIEKKSMTSSDPVEKTTPKKLFGKFYKGLKQKLHLQTVNKRKQVLPVDKKTQIDFNAFENFAKSLRSMLQQIQPAIHDSNKRGSKHENTQKYYHEKQSWIILIIYMYDRFVIREELYHNILYCPLKRKIMVDILKRLFDVKGAKSGKVKQKIQFKDWPCVLKFLEDNRPQISIVTGDQIVKKSQIILKQLYQNMTNSSYLKTMNNNIFEGGLEDFKQNLPNLKLVCLSKGKNKKESSTRCKIVHLLISGFLSEDANVQTDWADMVDTMPGCEVYGLIWQSNTITNLVLFLLRMAKDLLITPKMLQQLISNNPFNPAFQVSRITGRLLAELVVRLFPQQFVNLCGYSLGSEVIKQFLSRMVVSGNQGMLNRIFIMGGVTDIGQFQDIVTQSCTSLSIVNCITKHDSVLKHVLTIAKPQLKPMGINKFRQIPGHHLTNTDCSKFISGHLKYRSNFDIMGKLLEISIG